MAGAKGPVCRNNLIPRYLHNESFLPSLLLLLAIFPFTIFYLLQPLFFSSTFAYATIFPPHSPRQLLIEQRVPPSKYEASLSIAVTHSKLYIILIIIIIVIIFFLVFGKVYYTHWRVVETRWWPTNKRNTIISSFAHSLRVKFNPAYLMFFTLIERERERDWESRLENYPIPNFLVGNEFWHVNKSITRGSFHLLNGILLYALLGVEETTFQH